MICLCLAFLHMCVVKTPLPPTYKEGCDSVEVNQFSHICKESFLTHISNIHVPDYDLWGPLFSLGTI